MEFANQVIMKVNNLRTYMISLSTRQRILTIICCLLIIHLSVLTFGLTLIFTCGTVLGAWCALQLWKKPVLFQWDNVIPFLPHIAKQRPLFQNDSEGGKTLPTSGFSAREQEALLENRQSILQTEMSEFVRLMMRDFVVGWYRILSDDDQFSHNVFCHFKDMIKNVRGRFTNIDQRVFLCTLLHELRSHVDIFRRLQMSRSRLASKSSKLGRSAKQHSVVSIYETFAILHPALQSEEVEKEHLSQLSNSLILALLPSDVIQCDTMVFLLQDILINNVLQPLVHLISDPDFLNEAFILLLMDEPLGQDHRSADEKPSVKEELPCKNESEPTSKEEEAPRGHKDVPSGSELMGHDVDAESKEKAEKYKAPAEAEKMNSSTSPKQEMACRNENQSQGEINQKPDLDEIESSTKTLPSPFEIIEPPQQFTFPMPMTMLEPSKAIPRQDPESISKEELKIQDEMSEKVDLQNLGPTIKVKGHRRSASTGSNIITIQTPVPQTARSVIDGVIDSMATDDYNQSSRIQGMRSCFSAECLTELGECASSCQKTGSAMGVESGSPYQSASSLGASSDDISFRAPFNFETDVPVQEQEETDGQQVNAEDDSKLQASTSPKHRYPLLRSETAPELIQAPPDYHDPHPSIAGDIPLEWATWRVTNLNIPTTSWLGDPKGKRPVVYFIIKYDLLKKPTLSDDSKAAFSDKNEMEVRRRYREFVNLHARIINNPLLRRNMRGIANIPKHSMLPLSRPSPAMEEQKRLSLETYLRQLLSRPVIHNSREMAEFLAIDGDGHIEFVKKASNAPLRIDKLLIHQVSGIVGTIKTILPEKPSLKTMMRPSSQQTPSSAPAPTTADRPEQTMQSHDQNRPMTEESQVRQQPIGGEDQWDFGGVVDTSRIRLFGLDETKESHMQRVMKLLISERQQEFSQRMPSSSLKGDYEKVLLGPRSEGDGSDNPNEPHPEGEKVKAASEGSKGTVEVYQALFGVMSEALLNQQSFILDQDLQGTLTVLIGDLIDKWLFREVGLLFTEAQWGYYLSLLRELIWPGGVFNPKERETKTPEEMAQTKAAALHELTHNAAATVLSVILGEDHLREGISLVLDSLQDQELNKHLLFTFLDHAMDQLVPEIHDAKFQESLAAMP